MRIIYKNLDNSVGVLIPTQEALQYFSIEVIAEKDVPKDLPYKIVSKEDLPESREFREAWMWDNSIEPDGFGGESNKFDAELLKAYYGELNDSNK